MRSTLVFVASLALVLALVFAAPSPSSPADDDDHYKPTDSCNVKCSSNADCYGYVCSRCVKTGNDDGDGHGGDGGDGGDGHGGDGGDGGDGHGGDGGDGGDGQGDGGDGQGQGDDHGSLDSGSGSSSGTCSRGQACGSTCSDHLDCDQLSSCSSCINSKYVLLDGARPAIEECLCLCVCYSTSVLRPPLRPLHQTNARAKLSYQSVKLSYQSTNE